jgi:hypothetical protein
MIQSDLDLRERCRRPLAIDEGRGPGPQFR